MKKVSKKTKERILFFEDVLSDFWRKSGRHELPWRRKNITAYEVWVSEIMLQQTQVSRVIGYYDRFLGKFPTVEKLASSSWEDFLPYYEGLGYYARGRNMLRAAEVVASQYRGVFPRNKTELETLPGVGPYTASAIMSFAYGDKHLAWDTNLKRVVGRFFLGSKKAEIDEEWFEGRFTIPRKKLNAMLMDFGSSLCVSRPKCGACPLASQCQYFREQGSREKQAKKERALFTESEAEQVVVFLHEKHQRYFSSILKRYKPFLLPQGYTTRAAVKEWFLKKYGLTVAVRPPHKKVLMRDQKTLWVHAQILSGSHAFSVFPKKTIQEYVKIETDNP